MLRTEPDPAPSPPSRWLKSTEWLAEHLRDRDVVVVDASYPTVWSACANSAERSSTAS